MQKNSWFKPLIISLLYCFITLFTDHFFFDFTSLNYLNYWFCKFGLFIVIFVLSYLLLKGIKNWKNGLLRTFLIYTIPMLIMLLIIFPGFIYGGDIFGFVNYTKTCSILYDLNYLSSIFWIISLMAFPMYSSVIVAQVIIMGIVVTYIVSNLKKMFPQKKYYLLSYFIFFLFSTVIYVLYPNRPVIYGILYLALFSLLFFDYTKKDQLDNKKMFIICILTGLLSVWRSEGIYLVLAIPILSTVIYNLKRDKKKLVIIWIVPIVLYVLLSLPQNRYYNNVGVLAKEERNLPNIVNPLAYILTQDLKGNNLEEDLNKISVVLNIDAMKKNPSLYESVSIWADDGCIKSGYTIEEFNAMKEAYYDIVKNNFDIYLNAKYQTFVMASRLDFDHFSSYDFLDSYIGRNKALDLFIYNRLFVLKVLEGRYNIPVVTFIYKAFNSLLIPLISIFIAFIYSVIRKNNKLFLLSGMLLAHAFALFIISPSGYFMYYFPVYLSGYFMAAYYFIRYLYKSRKRILFISSTGGHLSELMQLKPIMDKHDYRIITEKTKTTKTMKKQYGNKIGYLIYGTRDQYFIYPFKFLINTFISLYYFIKFRPAIIITTGTHTAVPMCYIGKLFGSKIVFIETFANRTTKTLSGRLVYPIADLFVVQWKEMLKLYPKAEYFGGVY